MGWPCFVELLTGVLSGGGVSSLQDIDSWCFALERPNNVSSTYIVIDTDKFAGRETYLRRSEALMQALHETEKAKNAERIFVPGEMEWAQHHKAMEMLDLPDAAAESLDALSADMGIRLDWMQ